jgi:hypothetical protein
VEGTELWDGRTCVLQVTDAVGGFVRLRALVSAADAPRLWDLRCLVREHLVGWLRDRRPTALPRLRAEVGDASGRLPWQWSPPSGPAPTERPSAVRTAEHEPPDDARLFGGDDDGEARGSTFLGPDEPAEAPPR